MEKMHVDMASVELSGASILIELKCHDAPRFKERKMAEPITLEVFSDYV